MDKKAALDLLHALDDPVRSEAPAGWDRHRAEARFHGLVAALERRLGRTLPYQTGLAIQDASFHAAVPLPRELLTEDAAASLRSSNFDRLATIYDDDTIVEAGAMNEILATLQEHGYTYVPTSILMAPYTGPNHGVSGFRTWGERFFDWI